MPDFEHNRPRFWVLLALAFLLLFSGLSKGGLSGYDDALYAHEGKEMLRSGDWRNVRFNGDLNFEYPPLFIWLEAASMSAFGVTDFAAKLPSALAGIGTIALVYWIAAELRRDAWYATMAAMALATTQPFLKSSSHAMTDVPFTFFFALAAFLYLKGLREPRYLAAAGLPVGLAVLTRSVLGFLPLAVMLLHLGLTRRWKLLLSPQMVGGLLLAAAAPLWWFGAQYQTYGTPFLEGHLAFVFRKVEAGGWLTFQVVPYAMDLLKYYWPWLPVFLAGLVAQLRLSRSSFAPLWIIVVLAPLTQTSIPYGRYLMPAYPAMALLAAVALHRWIPDAKRVRSFWSACAIVLFIGVYTVLFPARERGVDIRALAPPAESASRAEDRLLLYTFGEQRYDYQNQLLWYADRYTEQIMEMEQLVAQHAPGRVGIIDKASFWQLPDRSTLEILAESEQFYCYQVL